MSYESDVYIAGHRPAHQTLTGAIKVDDTISNFTFDIDTNNLRDLLIENIGKNDCYIVLSPNALNDVEIPSLSRKDTLFTGSNVGWLMKPGKFIIFEYCDFSHIAMKCPSGKSTNMQIMGTLYPRKSSSGYE